MKDEISIAVNYTGGGEGSGDAPLPARVIREVTAMTDSSYDTVDR